MHFRAKASKNPNIKLRRSIINQESNCEWNEFVSDDNSRTLTSPLGSVMTNEIVITSLAPDSSSTASDAIFGLIRHKSSNLWLLIPFHPWKIDKLLTKK